MEIEPIKVKPLSVSELAKKREASMKIVKDAMSASHRGGESGKQAIFSAMFPAFNTSVRSYALSQLEFVIEVIDVFHLQTDEMKIDIIKKNLRGSYGKSEFSMLHACNIGKAFHFVGS